MFMALAALAAGAAARAQAPAEAGAGLRLLSLGTPALRDTMERWNPGFGRWPDLRLKLERPEELSLEPSDLEPRVRSIEFRLPASIFWVGYEWPSNGEDSRATFTIQRGF
jgi:hypothetical protein